VSEPYPQDTYGVIQEVVPGNAEVIIGEMLSSIVGSQILPSQKVRLHKMCGGEWSPSKILCHHKFISTSMNLRCDVGYEHWKKMT
jgi:hypothetical protein